MAVRDRQKRRLWVAAAADSEEEALAAVVATAETFGGLAPQAHKRARILIATFLAELAAHGVSFPTSVGNPIAKSAGDIGIDGYITDTADPAWRGRTTESRLLLAMMRARLAAAGIQTDELEDVLNLVRAVRRHHRHGIGE